MSFDELDELFKQGLGNREIPFDPTSWSKMNAALDTTNQSFWAKTIKVLSVYKSAAIAASVALTVAASSAAVYSLATDNEKTQVASTNPTSEVIEVAQSSLEPTTAATSIEVLPFLDEASAENKSAVIEQKEENSTPDAVQTEDENLKLEEYYSENESLIETESIVVFSKMVALGLTQNKAEHLLIGSEKRSKILANKERSHLTSFGLIAGLNVSQGLMNTATNRSRPDKNLVAGVHINRALNKKLSVSADILYQQREGLNSTKNYTNTTYSFGKTVETTQIEAISLHSVELPVYASLKISKLHRVYGGGYFAYTLNAKSAVKTSSNLPDVAASAAESWGYTKGFSAYDFGAMAGYAFSIFPKMQLGVRVNYGFKDLTQNDYYANSTFDNNFQVRFVLDYQLSKI